MEWVRQKPIACIYWHGIIVYNNNHINQKDVQMYFQGPRPWSFYSEVQICTYPNMSMIQEGQTIPRGQWIHWDAESIAQLAAKEVQGSDIDTASNSSENTIDMIIDCDIV